MKEYQLDFIVEVIQHQPTLEEKYNELARNYDKVVAACLRCDPIPACKRDDNKLEPPWEVIDRVRRERNIAIYDAKEYSDIIHRFIWDDV